jgi:S1-C subfamily serine protease
VGLIVDSCDPGVDNGSGIVIGPGLVLTAAHVLAGARDITVEQGGAAAEGTVVGFDPNMDLAYVAFDGPPTRTPTVASTHVGADDTGVAYVVRDAEVVGVPVRVRRRIQIRTEDIYIQGETVRPGFELEADIHAGDSGGAVVIGGQVAGVIWARSKRDPHRAYAIDAVRGAELIDEQLTAGTLGDDVDIARCH